MLPAGFRLLPSFRAVLNCLGLAAALFLFSSPGFAAPSPDQADQPPDAWELKWALQSASSDVRTAMSWVMQRRDNQGQPFAIVDKKSAALFIFSADGQLRGMSAALLGLTPGDHAASPDDASVPEQLGKADRTTPAGRFVSEPGRNLQGERIVWVDYVSRLAIHRLRPAPLFERRAERLASATPDDNRISLGCVVVPAEFYDQVVAPVLGISYGVVYVLPENQGLRELLGTLQLGLH